MRFAKRYFEELCRLPEKGDFDILAHFDLIAKNNDAGQFIDTSSKEYLHAGFETIHALKGKIPLFEVNTGAISRGYRKTPYPTAELLREIRQRGGGILISSDCHDKRFLAQSFQESVELARACGFEETFVLTDNGFEPIPLDQMKERLKK